MNKFFVQPYKAGANGSSLAIVLPSKIVKTYHFDPSTLFCLEVDDKTGDIKLDPIDISNRKNLPTDNSSLGSHQQVQVQ